MAATTISSSIVSKTSLNLKPKSLIPPHISPNSQLSLSSKLSLIPSIFLFSHIHQISAITPTKKFTISANLDAKPTILVAEKLGDAGLDLLKAYANVDCSYNLSPEELCTKISLCDALIVRSGTKVSREVFESSHGRLKVVGRAGVGIDNVDLGAATEHGCLVVNAPTANTIAAAEHGIALLTAMSRNIAQADASVKAGMFLIDFCLRHFVEHVKDDIS